MRLILQPDCTRARLEGRVSPAVIETLHRGLSFFDPKALRDVDYQTKAWDGRVYLFDPDTLQFPAGLTSRVLSLLAAHTITADVIDERPALPWSVHPTPPLLDSPDGPRALFSDQVDAFNAIVRGDPCGLIVHPTGGGKTVLAAAVFKTLRPHRGLFIVDQRGLMKQSADELSEALNERVGMIGDGRHETTRRVTVAVINSLWSRVAVYARELYPTLTTLIVDEAHTISENMWHKTLIRIPARVRIGLSATIREAPRRLLVESFLGPILYEGSVRELIDSGRLAEPTCYMMRIGGVMDDALDLDTAYTRAIIGAIRRRDRLMITNEHAIGHTRNRKIVAAARDFMQRDWPTVISVWIIDHGYALQKLFAEHDMKVPFIHGQSSLDEIEDVKRGLANGDVPCAIVSRIFDKGQNVPAIRALIMAGGNRSPLITIQRAGRGLRRKADDNRVVILDFIDHAHKTLRNQSRERQQTMARKYGAVHVIGSVEEIAE